jgi:hypothetical protein
MVSIEDRKLFSIVVGGALERRLGVIAVLRPLAFVKRAREDGANELCLGKRVALLRLHGEAVVRGQKPALERDVLGCDCRIAAKEVPEGEMVALLFGPGDAEMRCSAIRPAS